MTAKNQVKRGEEGMVWWIITLITIVSQKFKNILIAKKLYYALGEKSNSMDFMKEWLIPYNCSSIIGQM